MEKPHESRKAGAMCCLQQYNAHMRDTLLGFRSYFLRQRVRQAASEFAR